MNTMKREHLAMLASYQVSDLRSAGYSASDLLRAGCSASDLRNAGYSFDEKIPDLKNPYSVLLADIDEKKRVHNQSTFGPVNDPATNLCKTQMCTAGHLVNMAGEEGYALKEKYGWALAAALIHDASHPGWPCQNFNSIPQEWAMAYIEEMAAREQAEAK